MKFTVNDKDAIIAMFQSPLYRVNYEIDRVERDGVLYFVSIPFISGQL